MAREAASAVRADAGRPDEAGEVASLRRELDEARAQQAATGAILRVIGASAGDAQPVFDAIVEEAVRVCGAIASILSRVDGGELVGVVSHVAETWQRAEGPMPAGTRALRLREALRRERGGGRAVLERRTVQVVDGQVGPEEGYDPEWLETIFRHQGTRTFLAVPLLHGDAAVGVLTARRVEARAFSPREIALLEDFAAQAVIAMENARLFSEQQDSNRTLNEALVQQTATANVLRIIAASPTDVGLVLHAIAESAGRVCEAPSAMVFTRNGERLRVGAAVRDGANVLDEYPDDDGDPIIAGWVTGRAVLECRTVHVEDIFSRAEDFPFTHSAALRRGYHTLAAAPLMRDGAAVGAIGLLRYERQPFTSDQLRRLESFADQAAIAIENARLFSELQYSNATLIEQKAQVTEALERERATAGVLQVIAGAPNDLPRVLDAIAETAVRLFGCRNGSVYLAEDGHLRLAAQRGDIPPNVALVGHREPLDPGEFRGRAVLDGRAVHVPDNLDLAAYEGEFPATAAGIRSLTRLNPGGDWHMSLLAVPLLRRGEAIGVITVRRAYEPAGPFTGPQIALLETFASQAVIAIENARLFSELNESNATLKEALEQQTATGEVLRVIAASPADLDRVLQVIVETAARLCGAPEAFMRVVEGGHLRLGAAHGAAMTEFMRRSAPHALRRDDRSMSGLALARRRTVRFETPDSDPELSEDTRRTCRRFGVESMLAVPLLRGGDAPVGTLILARTEVAPFSDAEVALVESFAAQAVIALENTRLFRALEERDERRRQELERASAIQQRLLPSAVEGWPGLVEVAVRFRPAVETSGDFYDVLALPATQKGALEPLQIAVGDVAGKGMAAALVTALARSALQASASMPTAAVTPAGTLRVAGQRLHRDVGATHFVACALAVVEPPGLHHRGPRLKLANAAQAPVLLVRDGTARELEPPGYRLPLGAEADGDYQDVSMNLDPGDAVVFSSDGLAEAPALAGAAVGEHLSPPVEARELFGFDRLASSVAHWSTHAPDAEGVAAGIWADLTAWCGDESHHDDMTLLVLRVTA